MASSRQRPSETTRIRRPARSSGPPVGLIIAGIFLGLGVLGWAFMSGVNKPNSATTMIAAAEKAYAQGFGSTDVETKLRLAEADSSMSAEQRVQIKDLRQRLKVRDAEVALATHNILGTTYMQKKLKNYSDRYLTGKPDKPKARVFLQRCVVFKQRWPEHPEMDWVERQERRFAGFVSLSDAPTFEDVAWEAEALTYAKPRDYKMAFDALDSFMATASGDDKTLAANLKKTMEADRKEYHEDRMLQAEYELKENTDEAAAVQWLVWGVIGMGDQDMSDEAAKYLLNMPSVDAYLRGYRTKQPLVFERLKTYPMIKAQIDKLGD